MQWQVQSQAAFPQKTRPRWLYHYWLTVISVFVGKQSNYLCAWIHNKENCKDKSSTWCITSSRYQKGPKGLEWIFPLFNPLIPPPLLWQSFWLCENITILKHRLNVVARDNKDRCVCLHMWKEHRFHELQMGFSCGTWHLTTTCYINKHTLCLSQTQNSHEHTRLSHPLEWSIMECKLKCVWCMNLATVAIRRDNCTFACCLYCNITVSTTSSSGIS